MLEHEPIFNEDYKKHNYGWVEKLQ